MLIKFEIIFHLSKICHYPKRLISDLQKKTDCNHIFLNFAPTLTLSDLAKVGRVKDDCTNKEAG